MNDPLDELFGVSFDTLDTRSIEKYFDSLKRAVTDSNKVLQRADDSEVKEASEHVSNEFSWFESDFDSLVKAYEEAINVIAQYKSVVEERLTSNEVYELNTIRVKQAMIKVNKS